MGKPIETRVGGPNSIRALRELGLVVEGRFPDVREVTIFRRDNVQQVTVSPVIMTSFDNGTPVTETVLKPSQKVLQNLRE